MSVEPRFQTIIQGIRDDPQKFLYAQFAEGGAFQQCPVTRNDLDSLPIIMRLLVDERIFLAVTVWDYIDSNYSRCVYRAHNSWGRPKAWTYVSRTPYACTQVDDQPEFMPAYALDDATWAWKHCRENIPARNYLPEYAWFFPMGLAEALDGTSRLEYISNVSSGIKED